MKIGFLSDSHEQVEQIKKAVLFFNKNKPDVLIHLGDICSPIMAQYFKDLAMPFKIILGNNDGDIEFLKQRFDYAEVFSSPHEFDFNGYKILCMHEPEFLEAFALSNRYRLVAYGHTHKIDKKKIGNTFILNPGELSGILYGKANVAIFNDDNNEIKFFGIK